MKSFPISFPRTIPYICLFLSGLSSLTYELLWIKQLKLVFGGTLYAISAVLCAFMTGLALGAWLISKYMHHPRLKNVGKIKLYGILEGAIGLYGLLFPFLLKAIGPLYPSLVSLAGGSDLLLHFLEFLLSTVLMLPSTFMMGATLPVIGSWSIDDRSRIFSNLSFLYSLNTFGAVAGCLYTQFVATPILGIQGATYTAVGLNSLIFLLCWRWKEPSAESVHPTPKRKEKKPRKETCEEQPSRVLGFVLLIIFAYSGMVSLASEILWTRILVFPLGSSLFSFTVILATFLFGIALGSLVAKKLLGDSQWILKFLCVELAIGVFCLLLFPVLDQLTHLTLQADSLFYDIDNTGWKTAAVRSLIAFGLMFLPTLGFGLVFPLANHIHFSLFGSIPRTLGNSYAVNTVGAIVGTLITPFLLIPWLGIQQSLFLLYSLLVLLALTGWVIHRGASPLRWAGTLSSGIILLAGAYAWATPRVDITQLGKNNLARIEINAATENLKMLDYKEGNFSTLSVIEDTRNGARTLYIDGFSTATSKTSVGGSAYMQAMGWVPMMLHPNPQRALVMCFGTGNTLGTVARFPGVEVDGVEIDRNVLALANWFTDSNHDVLNRNNVHLQIQDARNFIQWTRQKYDVITLEPMSPVQAGVNNLYSREFYDYARERLNPGGLMMQWLPLHLVGPEDAWSIIKTFQSSFPHVTVWNSFLTRIVLLVGSNEPLKLNPLQFEQRMRNPEIKKMAEQIGVFSYLDFLDFYLTDGDPLAALLEEIPRITDDLPLLEHSPANLVPPLKQQTDETFFNLLRFRVGRFPAMEGAGSEKILLERSLAMRTAQRLSIFSQRYLGPGHALFREKNYREGLIRVQSFLDKHSSKYIHLSDDGWSDTPETK